MIRELSSLRGIFILFIFFHHCLNLYPGGGTMAVTFFFVLGGFSMTIGYKERVMKSDFSYREYITRRCEKFFPLHWLSLLVAFPLSILPFTWAKLPVFVINAALLQSWIPIKYVNISYNAVSWYLANTMFFAVVFPFILKGIVNSTHGKRIAIAATALVDYLFVVFTIPIEWYHAILYISPYMRLYDFVLGIYLAIIFQSLKERGLYQLKRVRLASILPILIVLLLVIESCILPQNTRLVAAIYWPMVALLILVSALIETNGGGISEGAKFCSAWAK